MQKGGNMQQVVDWSKIQIEPGDTSCEACGLPGHALRKVPDWLSKSPTWTPQAGEYPFLGAEGKCECGERLPLYPADEYSDRPRCGTCYGPIRSKGIIKLLHETQRRLGLSVSNELHVTPAVAYKIPGIPWCCSIACLESVLFGPGRCKACGTRLGDKTRSFGKTEYDYRAGTKYCELCAKKPQTVTVGERLVSYLRKYHPSLLVQPSEPRKKREPNQSYLARLQQATA
jgi:hypothetical protein